MSDKRTAGFALCGSFCTFKAVIPQVQRLLDAGFDIWPIMSETAYTTDTRFGTAKEFVAALESMTGRPVIHTIKDAEPIGPKKLLDVIVVAPCTGNTLGKLACGITDTSVTMAVKAHLRNRRPVVLALSTNDGWLPAAEISEHCSIPRTYILSLTARTIPPESLLHLWRIWIRSCRRLLRHSKVCNYNRLSNNRPAPQFSAAPSFG